MDHVTFTGHVIDADIYRAEFGFMVFAMACLRFVLLLVYMLYSK